MKYAVLARRAACMAVGIAALAAGSAQAATTTSIDTSACANPLLTQPFLSAHDSNWYTLIPGQTPGNFDGTGWQLSGGARIITTQLADGSTISVLDLPSGSKAVSPTMCVTSSYPTARTMVRDAKGSEDVFVYVSYEGTSTWTNPKNTGQVHGGPPTAAMHFRRERRRLEASRLIRRSASVRLRVARRRPMLRHPAPSLRGRSGRSRRPVVRTARPLT